MRLAFSALACAALISSPATAEPRPTALQAALDASSDGPLYAYEMRYAAGEVDATGKIDPTKPEGERVTVYTPPQEDWPKDFEKALEQIDAEADGDIWCAGFAETVPDEVSLISETETTATYQFTPLPEADADDTDRKVMNKLVAKITIDTADPAILGLSMTAPKSFKPALVARIKEFDMNISCARAPDGRTYAKDFSLKIAGSALGQAFSEHTERTILKLLAPE